MKKYELTPQCDRRKSFYGKATVIEDGSKKKLYSYDSLVCTIIDGKVILNNKIEQSLLFSNTTLRHIKEFLKQNDFKADTKSQFMSDYS